MTCLLFGCRKAEQNSEQLRPNNEKRDNTATGLDDLVKSPRQEDQTKTDSFDTSIRDENSADSAPTNIEQFDTSTESSPDIAMGNASSDSIHSSDALDTASDTVSDSISTETTFVPPEHISDLGITWVTVPPGTFTMGSPDTEWGRKNTERQHQVTLTHNFEIAVTEITLGQWTTMGYRRPHDIEEEMCNKNACPVKRISTEEILSWLDDLSVLSGLAPCYSGTYSSPYHCPGYRLPTEAEWEYAARAGTQTATYAGEPDPEAPEKVLEPIGCSAPVRTAGEKSPNPWGLYDMLGNREECVEWIGVYPATEVVNPFEPVAEELLFATRGPSSFEGDCRAAERGGSARTSCLYSATFRPVRTLPKSLLPESEDVAENLCAEMAPISCENTLEELMNSLVFPVTDIEGESVKLTAVSEHIGDSAFGILGTRIINGTSEVFLLVAHPVDVDERWSINPLVNAPDDATPLDIEYSSEHGRFIAILDSSGGPLLATSHATREEASNFAPSGDIVIPEGLTPRRIVVEDDWVVLAGDGIAILEDDEWSIPVPPQSGGLFNDVDACERGADLIVAAVGESGRVAVVDNGDTIIDHSIIENDLLNVQVYITTDEETHLLATGKNGLWMSGPAHAPTSCTIVDKDLNIAGKVKVPSEFTWRREIFAFTTSDNQILIWPHPNSGIPICYAHSPPSSLVSSTVRYCQDATNNHFFTEDGIYGENLCIRVGI